MNSGTLPLKQYLDKISFSNLYGKNNANIRYMSQGCSAMGLILAAHTFSDQNFVYNLFRTPKIVRKGTLMVHGVSLFSL